MSTDARTYNKDIKEQEQQNYKFGSISFIVEPRFNDSGNTLVSVLAKLLQTDLSSEE